MTTTIRIIMILMVLTAVGGRAGNYLEAAEKILRDNDFSGAIDAEHRIPYVKITSFYLKDGTLVTGKVVSQDKNRVIVAQVDESRIVVSTYGTKDIDLRTRSVEVVSELEYCEQLGFYYASRTGDFRDDPDDFIQAIRFYEKAGDLLKAAGRGQAPRIRSIQEKIEALKADREIWTREAQSRAELKRLEFESTFEQKFEELKKDNENYREKFDKLTRDFQKLGETVSFLERDLSWEIKRLGDDLISNRQIMDNMWQQRGQAYYPDFPRRYFLPRYYVEPYQEDRSPYEQDRQMDNENRLINPPQ